MTISATWTPSGQSLRAIDSARLRCEGLGRGERRDVTVYLVLNDHGQFGIAYDETDPAEADRETIICNFLTGQYGDALRVVAFNTAEGWSRDVSEDIAGEVLDRGFDADDNLSEDTMRFIDRHVTPGEKRPPAPSLRRRTDHALRVGGRKTGT